MPIPSPNKGESQKDFISRCMSDGVMNKEYSDQSQRAAICYSKWKDKKATAKFVVSTAEDEYIFDEEEQDEDQNKDKDDDKEKSKKDCDC